MESITLKVEGMHGEGCARTIQRTHRSGVGGCGDGREHATIFFSRTSTHLTCLAKGVG